MTSHEVMPTSTPILIDVLLQCPLCDANGNTYDDDVNAHAHIAQYMMHMYVGSVQFHAHHAYDVKSIQILTTASVIM
jgi:hypothetical protein